MPVWTPGSYLVREYARNIEAISVSDSGGKPLTFSKSRKNRWRVETGGAPEIRFSYRVYCREMSVRTNWVEDSFALLNGAPTFVTLVGGLARAARRAAGIAAAMENHHDRAARSARAANRIIIWRPITTRWSIRRSWPEIRRFIGSRSTAFRIFW